MADSGTLTRADLADTLNRQIGLSRTDSAAMIESILEHVTNALIDGENVKIRALARSYCAIKVNGLAAIQKPASKFRLRRAAF